MNSDVAMFLSLHPNYFPEAKGIIITWANIKVSLFFQAWQAVLLIWLHTLLMRVMVKPLEPCVPKDAPLQVASFMLNLQRIAA